MDSAAVGRAAQTESADRCNCVAKAEVTPAARHRAWCLQDGLQVGPDARCCMQPWQGPGCKARCWDPCSPMILQQMHCVKRLNDEECISVGLPCSNSQRFACRLFRFIPQEEVQEALAKGSINERKSDTRLKPCPKYVVDGRVGNNKKHIQVGQRLMCCYAYCSAPLLSAAFAAWHAMKMIGAFLVCRLSSVLAQMSQIWSPSLIRIATGRATVPDSLLKHSRTA